jgi:hypothetical protein
MTTKSKQHADDYKPKSDLYLVDIADHFANLAYITRHIMKPECHPNWNGCSINHPIANLINKGGKTRKVLKALQAMDIETAAIIVGQLSNRQSVE